MTPTRKFHAPAMIAAALALSVAIPAQASEWITSPSDRNLRKILVGADTSCDTPIYIAGTGGTLGGETGACNDTAIERLSFHRGAPVHVKLVSEEELATVEGRQCADLYKYSAPGAVTQYNVRNNGPFTFKTSTICVVTDNPVPTKLKLRNTRLDGSGSDSVRSGL